MKMNEYLNLLIEEQCICTGLLVMHENTSRKFPRLEEPDDCLGNDMNFMLAWENEVHYLEIELTIDPEKEDEQQKYKRSMETHSISTIVSRSSQGSRISFELFLCYEQY
jgi:hypothetical protein